MAAPLSAPPFLSSYSNNGQALIEAAQAAVRASLPRHADDSHDRQRLAECDVARFNCF
jgi:hypothetical protein